MSKELQLSRIITEKINQIDVDKNIKDFVLEILQFEKNIAGREGRVSYGEEYRKLIDKYAPRESSS